MSEQYGRSRAQWLFHKFRNLSFHPAARTERILWAGAVALFIGVFAASVRTLPAVRVDWGWILIAVGLVPGTIFLVGLEYWLAGRMLNQRVSIGDTFRVTILSSAANLLPLPGGVLVRSHALARHGTEYSKAFGSNVTIGLGWLGAALIVAGAFQIMAARWRSAVLFETTGLAIVAVMIILARLATRRSGRAVVSILALEGTYVIASALRLYAIMHGVGINTSFPQAVGLTVAAAVAAVVGVLPGGLGLRELLAGALGPILGLTAAESVFATAVDRVIGLLVLGVAAAVLLLLVPDRAPPGHREA